MATDKKIAFILMYKQHLRAARIKNNIAQALAPFFLLQGKHYCFVLLKNRLMFYVPYIYLFFEGYVPYIFPSLFSFT